MDRGAGHNPTIPESIRRVARQLPAVRQGHRQIAENQLLLERLDAYAAPAEVAHDQARQSAEATRQVSWQAWLAVLWGTLRLRQT